MDVVNLTGIDNTVIYTVNPALNASYFPVLLLPAIVLNALCVLALFGAEKLQISVRIIHINVMVADIVQLVGISILLLGFPFRLYGFDGANVSCNVGLSITFIGAFAKLPATALYTIVVYIYIKYGAEKLKLCVTSMSVVVTWALSTAFGLLVYSPLDSNQGFCSAIASNTVQITIVVILVLDYVVFTIVTFVFGILTFHYVKNHTMDTGDRTVQRAIVKFLAYLIVSVFISLLRILLPSVIQAIPKSRAAAVVIQLVLFHVPHALFAIPAIFTPILAFILLKPIRDTLKGVCCRNRNEEPTQENQQLRSNARPTAQPAVPVVHSEPTAATSTDPATATE